MEEVKKEECFAEFSGELKQAQEGREEYSDDWESTAKVVRETAQKLHVFPLSIRKRTKRWW